MKCRLTCKEGLAALLGLSIAGACGAAAQPMSVDRALTDQQLTGMRLFNQSCRVCHTKPQLASPLYGPQLSQSSAGGNPDVMRDVITNGTPRMPGFRYHFEPAEIEAIVAYLKTVSPAPAAPSPAASR
jgi:mono/diheme cytochrome c family protein